MFVNSICSVSQAMWRTCPGQLSYRAAAEKGQSLKSVKFSVNWTLLPLGLFCKSLTKFPSYP